ELVTAEDLLRQTKDDKTKADVTKALQGLVKALKDTQETAKDLYPLTPDKVGAQTVTPIDAAALADALADRSDTLLKRADELEKSAKDDAKVTTLTKSVKTNAKELGVQKSGDLPRAKAVLAPKGSKAMEWIDWLTRWGLTVIGLCLMVGLLSRTNAWLGALFLL